MVATAERRLSIRFDTQGSEVVRRALTNLGEEGQAALRKIERASKEASAGLKAVNVLSEEGQSKAKEFAATLGPAGRALTAMGPAGLAAAAGVGAIFAGGKILLDLGMLADKANAASAAFGRLSARAGRDATQDLRILRAAVRGTISDLELMQRAGQALDAGLGFEKTVKALTFIRTYASTFGKDFNELSSTVMTGLIRGSVLRLDDVGINISETDKMFEGLEGNAKKVAVVNEAFRQMEEKLRVLKPPTDTLTESVQKAGVAWDQLGTSVGQSGGKLKGAVDVWTQLLTILGEDEAGQRMRENLAFLDATSAHLLGGGTVGKYGIARLDEMLAGLGPAPKGALVDVDVADIEAERAASAAAEDARKKAEKEQADHLKKLQEQARKQGPAMEIRGGFSNAQLVAMAKARAQAETQAIISSVIQPTADLAYQMSGEKSAGKFTFGFRQGLQLKQAELALASKDQARYFSEDFASVIADAFGEVLEGDFGEALKTLGTGTVETLAGEFITAFSIKTAKDLGLDRLETLADATGGLAGKKMADGIKWTLNGGLSEFFSGTTLEKLQNAPGQFTQMIQNAVPMDQLRAAGDRWGSELGTGLRSGMTTFFLGSTIDWLTGGNLPKNFTLTVSLAQTFLAEFGEKGSVWQAINTGTTNALKGAAMGAAIGQLIGDDITAQKAAIAGAIGAAIGSTIPGIGPVLGSALASSLVGVVDKIFFAGAREKAEGRFRDVLTDVQAFGGVQGFVQRIGGFQGIRGERGEALLEGGYKSEFTDLFRTSLGATKEQAEGMVDVLRQVARVNAGDSNSYLLGGISQDLGAQIKNVMAQAGFSKADLDKILFQSASVSAAAPGGTGNSSLPGTPGVNVTYDPLAGIELYPGAASQVPAGKPVVVTPGGGGTGVLPSGTVITPSLSPQAQAATLLTRMLQDNTVSRSALKALGSAAVSGAAGAMGGVWPSFVPALVGVMAGSPHDEVWLRSRGIDVVAAKGWHGTVNRPTTFLAGEAGPEDVEITPRGRGYTGGGGNSRQTVNNFTLNIYTLDANSFRAAWPTIKAEMMRESNAGVPLMHEKGLVRR